MRENVKQRFRAWQRKVRPHPLAPALTLSAALQGGAQLRPGRQTPRAGEKIFFAGFGGVYAAKTSDQGGEGSPRHAER